MTMKSWGIVPETKCQSFPINFMFPLLRKCFKFSEIGNKNTTLFDLIIFFSDLAHAFHDTT